MVRARVARFYGWSDRQIGNTPYSDLLRYHRVISNLKAEEMLDLLSVESYPHLKQNKRSDFFNKLKRIARLGIAKKQTKSVKQLALEAIGRMANG